MLNYSILSSCAASRPQPVAFNSLNMNIGRRESSPIKEALLSKFARLTPISGSSTNSQQPASMAANANADWILSDSINNDMSDNLEYDDSTISEQPLSSSWLGHVKGMKECIDFVTNIR